MRTGSEVICYNHTAAKSCRTSPGTIFGRRMITLFKFFLGGVPRALNKVGADYLATGKICSTSTFRALTNQPGSAKINFNQWMKHMPAPRGVYRGPINIIRGA